MASEKNALAELAEKIGCLGKLHYSAGVIQTDELTSRDYEVIDKAQRIIAELANIGWWRSPFGWRPRGNGTSEIIIKCREIAEEGVNNENN